ncbi:hypothetical protein [Liquorilactobacillus mali]|uniref:Uncharacterized protein n=1 Tax=Liquorilactobacillus mali KCTC 3596 = DSM 20444 TaxID=1046596 RepID=A0A0R2EBR6_9LACO|nr:hypothetical protein [Liquorilactobacillus mali]KRN09396.1 hypothetical protein FD00_GL001119 [Liquorilactobacillus mali KCTC 3596 = DSM 20444]
MPKINLKNLFDNYGVKATDQEIEETFKRLGFTFIKKDDEMIEENKCMTFDEICDFLPTQTSVTKESLEEVSRLISSAKESNSIALGIIAEENPHLNKLNDKSLNTIVKALKHNGYRASLIRLNVLGAKNIIMGKTVRSLHINLVGSEEDE